MTTFLPKPASLDFLQEAVADGMSSRPNRSRGRRSNRLRRRAFTLIELLLVLAVLVIVFALAMPAFKAPLENQRLRKSGERIRIEWSRARIEAMKTGRVQAFYYTSQGNQYWIEPLQQADDLLEASLDARVSAVGPQAARSVDPMGDSDPFDSSARLPDNVVFVSGGSLTDQRDAMALAESQGFGNVDQGMTRGAQASPTRSLASTGNSSVAPPILFYPDGTTATARVILGNTRNHFVVVELRGLTGLARASDLLTAQELPQ